MTVGATPAPLVELGGVSVTYDVPRQHAVVEALQGVDLAIARGSFTSLIGPSGCGKSTLLRVVADLMAPTSGQVLIEGQTPACARRARQIGFVFQEPALLEWRSVLENVALPLELQGIGRAKREAEAGRLIDLVGLSGFEAVWPSQLSGGMKQRASIARALSTSPHVMLMDEPFGALDQITRDRMNLELARVFEETGVTVLFCHSFHPGGRVPVGQRDRDVATAGPHCPHHRGRTAPSTQPPCARQPNLRRVGPHRRPRARAGL